jgi:hypothetical protein
MQKYRETIKTVAGSEVGTILSLMSGRQKSLEEATEDLH